MISPESARSRSTEPVPIWGQAEGALRCRFFGRLEYSRALQLQESLIEESRAGQDHLVLLEHPPVYTTGRNGDPDNLPAGTEGVAVFRTGRGGDATYHGPGQLVGYPIVDLRRRRNDVHGYLRSIESGLIDLLHGYGVPAETASGRTGIWVPDQNQSTTAKIASIGIAVRRGIAWHGFAINVAADLSGFEQITACGIPDVRMTSIAQAGSGATPELSEVARSASSAIARALGPPLTTPRDH